MMYMLCEKVIREMMKTAKKIFMSAMTATIMLMNLEEERNIRKKYKDLSHMKNTLTELIALSVCGKS